MIKVEIIDWADFKQKVTDRKMCPQWYTKKRGQPFNDQYKIYAQDGFLMFEWVLEKDGGTNVTDFETNYKDNWNAKLDYRDAGGLNRIHTSPRPEGTTTYFSGAGDSGGVGGGVRLLFNMPLAEGNVAAGKKSKTITFSEEVFMKDGIIDTVDAPMGSKIDIELFDNANNLIGTFVKTFNLLKSRTIYLNSEDSESLPKIGETFFIKMKVTVTNSITPPGSPTQEQIDNGVADHETPKAFYVVGNMEMYRATTI